MDNLRLGVEWDLNEQELQAVLQASKKNIEGVGQSLDSLEKSANNNVQNLIARFEDGNETIEKQSVLLDKLKEHMAKLGDSKGFVEQQKALQNAINETANLLGGSLGNVMDSVLDGPDAKRLQQELEGITDEFDKIDHVVSVLNGRMAEIDPIDLLNKDALQGDLDAIAMFNGELRKVAEDTPTLTRQLSQVKAALAELELQGKANTEEYRALRDIALELDDAIVKTNQTFKSAASQSAQLDKAVRGVQSLISAYSIAQSAAALLGSENEDLQKGILKITAAMSMLQGLQQLQLEMKRRDNVLTTSQIILQRGYAIAVGQSTGALRLFRLALLGTGIGVFIASLSLLVEWMGKVRDEQAKARKFTDELNESMKQVPSSVARAKSELEGMATRVKLAKEGLVDKNKVLKEYNDGLGKTFGAARSVNEVDQKMIANADKFIEVTHAKAKAMAIAELAAKKYAEMIELQVKDDQEFIVSDLNSKYLSSKSVEVLKRGAGKKRDEQIAEVKTQYDRLFKLHDEAETEWIAKLKKSGFIEKGDAGTGKNAINKSLEERLRLLQEVTKVQDEYAGRTDSSEERELKALDKRFEELRGRIKKFNEDKANKIKIVLDVDTMQSEARENLAYMQNTSKIEAGYKQDYELYKKYQDFKKEAGAELADAEFVNDLSKIENYYARLRKELEALWDKVADGTASGVEKDRFKKLKALSDSIEQDADEARRKELVDEHKKYGELLEQLITYDQKRKKLIADFEADRAKIVNKATAEELTAFDRQHVEKLNALDDANIQQLQAHKDLFEGIEKLSDSAARKVIADSKRMLKLNKDMSADERKKIEKAIDDAERSLDDRLPERIMQVSGSFSSMATDVRKVNEELGDMLLGVSDVLKATVQIRQGFKELNEGLANFKEWKADGKSGGLGGAISAVAGVAGPVGQIVSAVTGVVSGVVGFFKASKESARQAAAQIKAYQDSVIAGELEHNRVLRERARSQADINALTKEELEQRQQLLQLQSADASREYDELLKRIQREGSQITGQKTEKYGGFLGMGKKSRVVDITKGISGYTYEELEELYTAKKLTAETTALFEELRKARQEIDGLIDDGVAAEKVLLDKMSGGVTSESISGGIIQGLKDGKRAFEDFGEDIEDIIENALLAGMAADILEEPIKDFVKNFRDAAKDGLDNNEIEAFKKAYEDVVKSGLDAIKDIEQLTGKTIGKEDYGDGIPGRINRGTSEATSSEILGFERARFDLAKQNLEATLSCLDFDERSLEQTIQAVRHLKAIEKNTADTVKELKAAVVELKAIKENTNVKVSR